MSFILDILKIEGTPNPKVSPQYKTFEARAKSGKASMKNDSQENTEIAEGEGDWFLCGLCDRL